MNASTDNGGTWKGSGNYAGPGDLEREGDQLRADMDRTLDEIERELSPRKLLDRSLHFFQEHGSDFVREAGDTIRRNPLPILLTAAGVVWLTASVASSRSSSSSSSPQRQRWSGDGSHLDEDMASFEDFSAGHGYADTSEQSRRSEQSSGESRTRQWQQKTKQMGSQVGSQAKQMGSEVGSQLARLVREQPVALGALALAAGALLGAALPMTEYENRMMGPMRGRSPWGDRDESGGRNEGRTDEGRESSAADTTADTTMVDE